MKEFWTTGKVDTAVDIEFVLSKLGPKYFDRLYGQRFDGDGLTDDLTYIDHILSKCKRLLLILVEIGCPDHIFDFINGNYGDDDLPLSEGEIWDLDLSRGKNSVLDKRFYHVQFNYVVKEFGPGTHVDYGPEDVVPVKSLSKAKGILSSRDIDKVIIHGNSYIRHRTNLGGDRGVSRHQFVNHFKALQLLQHPHLTSVWATYTHESHAYVLLPDTSDVTLKSFLDDPPKRFRALNKLEKRNILLRWVHCLASAVAYLHDNCCVHQAIRPSNIFIDGQDNIFLGEFAAMDALEDDEKAFKTDIYEHAPPEKWQRKPINHEMTPSRSIHVGGSRTGRRVRAGSDPPSSFDDAFRSHTVSRTCSNAGTMSINRASGATPDLRESLTRPSRSTSVRQTATQTYSTAQHGPSKSEGDSVSSPIKSTVVSTLVRNEIPHPYPSDVFSLSAVYLQLLTAIFYLASSSFHKSDYSPSSLRAHLGQKNRTAGRGGAPPDSSFHANLGQVSLWLDKLEQEANKRSEGVFYAVSSLIEVVRQGLNKHWPARWHAEDGERRIREILLKWSDSGIGRCCHPGLGKKEPEMIEADAVRGHNWPLKHTAIKHEAQTSEETVKRFFKK